MYVQFRRPMEMTNLFCQTRYFRCWTECPVDLIPLFFAQKGKLLWFKFCQTNLIKMYMYDQKSCWSNGSFNGSDGETV